LFERLGDAQLVVRQARRVTKQPLDVLDKAAKAEPLVRSCARARNASSNRSPSSKSSPARALDSRTNASCACCQLAVPPTVSVLLSSAAPSRPRASPASDIAFVIIVDHLAVNVLEYLPITAIFEALPASLASFPSLEGFSI